MDRGQSILLAGASLILCYQTIKGWRLGLVRQLARFIALGGAYGAGFMGGKTLVPFLRPLGYPDFILQCLGGVLIGCATYFAIALFSRILFKRTADQEFTITWFLYGLSGAVLGLGFGLVILFMMATSIRVLGTLAETASTAPTQAQALRTAPGNKPNARPSPASQSAARQKQTLLKPLMDELVGLKHAMETGVVGETLQMVDPVPKSAFELTRKMGEITVNPDACVRFLAYPGARELAGRPEIIALRDDPEVLRAAAEGRYNDLLKNQRVLKTLNNPKIAEMLKNFELEKALDYALAK